MSDARELREQVLVVVQGDLSDYGQLASHGPGMDEPLQVLVDTLAAWESEPDRSGLEPMDLPQALASGAASAALERIWRKLALAGTSNDDTGKGTLYSPATSIRHPPGKLVERVPLRVIRVAAADLETVRELAAGLASNHPDMADAVEQITDDYDLEPSELKDRAAALAALLTFQLNDAQQALVEHIAAATAADPAADVTLDAAQHATYKELIWALNRAVTGGEGDRAQQWVAVGE